MLGPVRRPLVREDAAQSRRPVSRAAPAQEDRKERVAHPHRDRVATDPVVPVDLLGVGDDPLGPGLPHGPGVVHGVAHRHPRGAPAGTGAAAGAGVGGPDPAAVSRGVLLATGDLPIDSRPARGSEPGRASVSEPMVAPARRPRHARRCRP